MLSPLCAVRTFSSLDQNKTVFVKAHCGRSIEFEGKQMVLLEGIVVGMGFGAFFACCDKWQTATKNCPQRCRFTDINYLFWSKEEKKQQEELLNPFASSVG